ncbi:MAG: site-specific integrase [Bacillota bacterium]|nr:site-specific integrase [Bacillota bacterium]
MANIVRHGKGWMARVYYQDNDGKRKSKSKGGFKTKGEAKGYAVILEKELLDGGSLNDCDTPLPEYFWKWYETFKEPIISARTKKSYENTYSVLKKYFNGKALSDITRTAYQSFLTEYGKTHAKETIQKINVHVRACVKNALYDKLIPRDFTERTSVVFDKTRTQQIEYLNIAQMKKLVEYISSSLNTHFTSKYMILLAVYTGMRLGELQGLQWRDINFNFKTISVRRAWSDVEDDFKETKNKSSIRTIRVNDDILNYFRSLKQSISPETNKQQVFLNQYGTVPSSNAVNKTLRESLKKIGVEKRGFHFHSLRHTHVAYLLANQIDLYAISKRLGHSDIGTTSRVYSYLIDEYKAKTDTEIENALKQITSNDDSQKSAL